MAKYTVRTYTRVLRGGEIVRVRAHSGTRTSARSLDARSSERQRKIRLVKTAQQRALKIQEVRTRALDMRGYNKFRGL